MKRAGSPQAGRQSPARRESGQEIAIGTATDPYQPAEGRFGITRQRARGHRRVPGLRVGHHHQVDRGRPRPRDPGRLARTRSLVNVSLISLDADLLRHRAARSPARPPAGGGADPGRRRHPHPRLPHAGAAAAHGRGARAARAAGRGPSRGRARGHQPALFLRTEMTCGFFLDFVGRGVPRALSRYRALYPRPGNAPTAYREEIDRRVAGSRPRWASRPARGRSGPRGGPARPRQLAIEW